MATRKITTSDVEILTNTYVKLESKLLLLIIIITQSLKEGFSGFIFFWANGGGRPYYERLCDMNAMD